MSTIAAGILGLDVGDKRVGIAIADPEGRYALPFKTVLRARGAAEEEILKLIRERGVRTVVAGLPLGRSGERNEQCLKVENFCRRLKKRADIDLVFVDEHLSSEEAREKLGPKRLRQDRKQGRQNTGTVDAVAASIILGEYLNSRANG